MQAPEITSDSYTVPRAEICLAEDSSPAILQNLDLNKDNREIDFITQLKAISSIDEIALATAKKLTQDFLLKNPKSKSWVNLFFNVVNLYRRELQLFLVGESEQSEISRPKQIANLAVADDTQAQDGQQLLF